MSDTKQAEQELCITTTTISNQIQQRNCQGRDASEFPVVGGDVGTANGKYGEELNWDRQLDD